MENFNATFNSWLDRVREIVGDRAELSFKIGRKYIKVIENGGSVFCFVDPSNGDVLKAATWSKPAIGARGNIAIVGREGVDKWGALYKNQT